LTQLGFVIDHSRCIGCHACTVACKSENDVPLGNFRTWVKYTERGEFPQVRRHFAVLRCNQCTAAPCVAICPTNALAKRPDGIVDIDPAACIGCKSCMQGCPYDALYINPDLGTAQKCHFCAHRTERGLAPACAVVCPTEAIIPGDFDDPTSLVARLRAEGGLAVRKAEAGTGPNVYYKEADAAGLSPLATHAAGGYIWSQQLASPQLEADRFRAQQEHASAAGAAALAMAMPSRPAMPPFEPMSRTVYDVPRPALWGWKVSAYLFTKSAAAGLFLAAALLGPGFLAEPSRALVSLGGALAFMLVTTALLVLDLKRPERFLYILLRPNWNSWLARGSVILIGYSNLLVLWVALGLFGPADTGWIARPFGWLLIGATAVFAVWTAGYTAKLFAQAKGRVLWMQRGLFTHLVAQALVAGAGLLLLAHPFLPGAGPLEHRAIVAILVVGLVVHAYCTLAKARAAPRGRSAEYAQAVALVTRGPYARRHWVCGVALGIALPLALLLLPLPSTTLVASLAALAALVGLASEEDVLVRAGQALPIS